MTGGNPGQAPATTYPGRQTDESGARLQSVLFLGINLVSLVLFSAVVFRENEVNLLHGLDGAYIMTIVSQQPERPREGLEAAVLN